MMRFHFSTFLSINILKIISVILMYRKYSESASLFHEKLKILNPTEEVDIMLGDFNLNA